ncbi:unnamed protein product, partial [Coregonus sp. 'balchen']
PSMSRNQTTGTPLSSMDPLNTLSNFESEMEPDRQGNYSLFPALDNMASLAGTAEALESAKSSPEAVMYRESIFSSSDSAASLPPFPSGLSETRPKTKKGPRKNQNEKYRLKYLRLRKAAWALISENAALCDEVAHLEEKFVRAKEERRFLLKSLLQYQSVSEGELLTTASTSSHTPVTFSSGPMGAPVLPGGHILAPGTSGAEEGLPKKPKKERKERGRENGKEDGG